MLANVLVVVLFVASLLGSCGSRCSLVFLIWDWLFLFLCVLNFCFVLLLDLFPSCGNGTSLLIRLSAFWSVETGNYFSLSCPCWGYSKRETCLRLLPHNVMGFALQRITLKRSPNKNSAVYPPRCFRGNEMVCLQEYAVNRSDKFWLTQKCIQHFRCILTVRWPPISSSRYMNFWYCGILQVSIPNSRRINTSRSNGSSVHELDVNGKNID